MLLARRAEGIDGNAAVITRGRMGGLPISGWVVDSTASGRPICIVDNGKVLEIACRVPFVHTQLRAFRPAAALLGWGHVVDFLLQGQEALAKRQADRATLGCHQPPASGRVSIGCSVIPNTVPAPVMLGSAEGSPNTSKPRCFGGPQHDRCTFVSC